MAILARNKAGEYGVPGVGIFAPGETKEVPMEVAAALRQRPEFEITADASDLALRDADGSVRSIGYFGPVDARFGYGSAGITILRALTRLGVEAQVSPHYNKGHGEAYLPDLPEDARRHLQQRRFIPQVALVHCLPDDLQRCDTPRKVAWTMWETNRIPNGNGIADALGRTFGDWAGEINRHAERLIVPCKHNAELFAACGVELPIAVLPYGLDTEVWPYFQRPQRDTFTVFQYGDLTTRKGVQEAVDAFRLAFPTERNVRLILKTQGGLLDRFMRAAYPTEDRLVVVTETWTRAELVTMLHASDCFIWPSRGEGFGLPPLQAALTGLPVVMTTHTGMGEYYRPNFFYGIKTAGTSPSPMGGAWYEPDVQSAAEQLRKVYEDRAASLKRGKSAATYIRNNFSLDAFATRLGAYLETL